jgi:hypothetical protein
MTKFLIIGSVLFGILACIFVARFVLGGDEDTWICANNQWVKHGNPSAAMPTTICEDVQKK